MLEVENSYQRERAIYSMGGQCSLQGRGVHANLSRVGMCMGRDKGERGFLVPMCILLCSKINTLTLSRTYVLFFSFFNP